MFYQAKYEAELYFLMEYHNYLGVYCICILSLATDSHGNLQILQGLIETVISMINTHFP